jgi:hypothetical protein
MASGFFSACHFMTRKRRENYKKKFKKIIKKEKFCDKKINKKENSKKAYFFLNKICRKKIEYKKLHYILEN